MNSGNSILLQAAERFGFLTVEAGCKLTGLQSTTIVKRLATLTELAERVDITLANLSILKTGKAKAIRFSTLEAICRELQCQPGDLLGYETEV